MKRLLSAMAVAAILIMSIGSADAAISFDRQVLSNIDYSRCYQAPVKGSYAGPPDDADPPVTLQGGDRIEDATWIYALPYHDTGTTIGYHDDYDVSCPNPGFAPDVVYAYTPAVNETIDIDLFGSNYDTRTWVYENNTSVVVG